MSNHFRLSSELTGAIAKRLSYAKNQLSVPGSFFNQFVTYIYIYIYILSTGWLISSDTSFFRYTISYTRTILVIMVFRDCNSNILNGFKRFFETKTWNCVLYGDFYGGKMCPGTQQKSRIKVTASVKNVFIIAVL